MNLVKRGWNNHRSRIQWYCLYSKNSVCPFRPPISHEKAAISIQIAMTVNKAQEQSLCFIDLFYVGSSRVGNPDNLFIYAPNRNDKRINICSSIIQHPAPTSSYRVLILHHFPCCALSIAKLIFLCTKYRPLHFNNVTMVSVLTRTNRWYQTHVFIW